MGHSTHTQQKVGWGGYLAFFITIILSPGMLAKSIEWWRVSDFIVLNGAFGQINAAGDMTVSFRGTGGIGAKDSSLFALELAPSVILSLGIISVAEGLGGLCAAQQLVTSVLRPLLGVLGTCSPVLIANPQDTDAAAGMTKEMAEEGIIAEQECAILVCWQASGSVYTTNYLSSDVAPLTMVIAPVITPLAVIFIFRFVNANLLRVWIAQLENRRMQQEVRDDDTGT